MMIRNIKFAVFISILLLSLYSNANAEGYTPPAPQPVAESWHFMIAPYGWFSSIDGDVTVGNATKHVAIPFSKIFHNLDFAGEVHLEAIYGRWSFMIDPAFLKLTTHFDKFVNDVRLTSKIWLVDSGIFYRVFSNTENSNYLASFELLGGARYLGVDNEFNFSRFPNLNVSADTNLFVPIVGGRFKFDVYSKLHFWLRGDDGGFGLDDVSNTWSVTVGASYTVHRCIDLGIAYRALGIDFSRKAAKTDITLYGPMLGIAFNF